ncbi:HNH endonuclease [Sinorhizobium sp. RAC02]|uniref:HNH endonuclease n=1 Tax=Sinorhizobium sp. RAC02 TaxID=1842534 RepID=UPI0008551466|nr:HNH endonuclease [Sinorhizobium sp. RAC02]AOF89489.1 hypothetical protein BSY16_2017 [Sinorhizobium sp. RAC02]
METVFPPVFRCIYCGDREGPFSKEHVIPYGLGGTWILPRSSCEDCRKKTQKVENFCLRNHFGNTRIALDLKTRHPEQRPESVAFQVTKKDLSIESVYLNKNELPIFLVLPQYPVSRLLRTLTDKAVVDPLTDEWVHISDFDALSRVSGDGGAVKIASMDFTKFARFLAKMAHGYLVCIYGLDGFQHLLTDLICEKTEEYWHWVGSAVDWFVSSPTDDVFQMQSITHTETGHLIVRIRLFPNLSAPVYHVIGGKLRS